MVQCVPYIWKLAPVSLLKNLYLHLGNSRLTEASLCTIVSDNATTFHAAAVEPLPVRLQFIPPSHPWFGGFYEWLVSLIKAPLKKLLRKPLLWFKGLETVILEVEHLVNHRPLTHIGSFDDEQPITPAMLMGNVWQETLQSAETGLSTQYGQE